MSPPEIIEHPWLDDTMKRKADADFMHEMLLSMYKHSNRKNLVFAVNAEWGAGKTYLLENWYSELVAQHPVIHFDAWANDFSDDALTSFIAEMASQLSKQFPYTKNIERFKTCAKSILKAGLYLTASAGLKHLAGASSEGLHAVYNSVPDDILDADKLNEMLASRIFEQHAEKRKAIEQFKAVLADIVNNAPTTMPDKKLPLFVLIDELDRCRPDFSIQLLEGIKHIFNVDGVFFVLAINKSQLCESIKVNYGSQFKADTYLKRFFDLELNLKCALTPEFIANLLIKYGLVETMQEAVVLPELTAVQYIHWVAKCSSLSLRDCDQAVMALMYVCTALQNIHVKVYLPFLLPLIVLKQKGHGGKPTDPEVARLLVAQGGSKMFTPLDGNKRAFTVSDLLAHFHTLGEDATISTDDVRQDSMAATMMVYCKDIPSNYLYRGYVTYPVPFHGYEDLVQRFTIPAQAG